MYVQCKTRINFETKIKKAMQKIPNIETFTDSVKEHVQKISQMHSSLSCLFLFAEMCCHFPSVIYVFLCHVEINYTYAQAGTHKRSTTHVRTPNTKIIDLKELSCALQLP